MFAVALAWALLFLPHLFLGRRVVFSDASYYRPFAEFSRTRWRDSHQRTYWNPYVFMGLDAVASFADPRPQYLPDPLLDLTERLSEPARSPQLWLLLAHLAGTLSLFVLSRRLWGADPWSAAAGALTWMLAVPILGPFAHGFDAQLLADAAIPVLLLCTQGVMSANAFRAVAIAALGLALTLGIQCLHGHPQILVYSSMLLALFASQQAWQHRRLRRLLPWAGAVALGAAIGAAGWWPALIYSGASSRSGPGGAGIPMAVVAKYSYHWRDLLSLIWPQAVGFGRSTYWGGLQLTDYSPYLGAVAGALALGGFRRTRGDGGSRFWWGVFIVSVLLSLGATLGPLFEALHATIPFWSKFRVVSYVMIAASVAFALLVARGASRALAPPLPGTPSPRLAPVLVVLAVLGATGLAIAFGPLRHLYIGWARASRPQLEAAAAGTAATWAGLDLLAIATLVAAGCGLLAWAWKGGAAARPAIVMLVALDLAAVVGPGLWRASGPPSAVEPPPRPLLAQVAARSPHSHVYVGAAEPVAAPGLAMGHYQEAYTNFWVSWRTRCLTGNHGAFPAAWQPVIEGGLTRYARVLRAWGVEWYDVDRSAQPLPDQTPAREDGRVRVYGMRAALGRAYAVPLVVALPDVQHLVAAMAHPDFEPALAAVTTEPSAAGEYPGSQGSTIRWVRDEPERLVLDVAAPERAFLVVADSYSTGWTARVDGQPVPIYSVDVLVRGLALPPGHHQVEMTYATPGMRAGTVTTRSGLGLWLALFVVWAGGWGASAWGRRWSASGVASA